MFVFINPKLNEINNKKTHNLNDYIYYTKVNVKCNINFFDKIENKTKNIMIERDNLIEEENKIMQSSKGTN